MYWSSPSAQSLDSQKFGKLDTLVHTHTATHTNTFQLSIRDAECTVRVGPYQFIYGNVWGAKLNSESDQFDANNNPNSEAVFEEDSRSPFLCGVEQYYERVETVVFDLRASFAWAIWTPSPHDLDGRIFRELGACRRSFWGDYIKEELNIACIVQRDNADSKRADVDQ